MKLNAIILKIMASVSNHMYFRIRVTVVSVRDKEMWNIGR
jgi:hypothetical protein